MGGVFAIFLNSGGRVIIVHKKQSVLGKSLSGYQENTTTLTLLNSALDLLKAIFTYCSVVGGQDRERGTHEQIHDARSFDPPSLLLFLIILTFPHPGPKR